MTHAKTVNAKIRGLRAPALALALGLLLSLCPVRARAAWNDSYDVQKAVNYARTYAYTRNTNYYYFPENDCCNYVSQALRAGGLQDISTGSGWFCHDGWYSYSWTNCAGLMAALQENGISIVRNPSYSDIRVGDIIFYDFPKLYAPADGTQDHVTIVTGVNDWGVPLICSHTRDRLDAVYDYGQDGTVYWVAQLAPRGWTQPVYYQAPAQTWQAQTQTQTTTAVARTGASYALDMNASIDGVFSATLGTATADVYVDGVLMANDVSDFCQLVQVGASYEIKDVKCSGYTFNGASSGSLSGVQAGYTSVVLSFTRNPAGTQTAQTAPAYSYSNYTYSPPAVTQTALTTPTDWTVWVNGYPLSFWPQAYITADNRMMAPAWSLAGALGGAVVYSDGGVVDVWYNNGLMEWKAGQQSYTVEGAPHSIRCAPSASPYALFVGVRDMAEAMGYTVSADNAARTVKLSK